MQAEPAVIDAVLIAVLPNRGRRKYNLALHPELLLLSLIQLLQRPNRGGEV